MSFQQVDLINGQESLGAQEGTCHSSLQASGLVRGGGGTSCFPAQIPKLVPSRRAPVHSMFAKWPSQDRQGRLGPCRPAQQLLDKWLSLPDPGVGLKAAGIPGPQSSQATVAMPGRTTLTRSGPGQAGDMALQRGTPQALWSSVETPTWPGGRSWPGTALRRLRWASTEASGLCHATCFLSPPSVTTFQGSLHSGALWGGAPCPLPRGLGEPRVQDSPRCNSPLVSRATLRC